MAGVGCGGTSAAFTRASTSDNRASLSFCAPQQMAEKRIVLKLRMSLQIHGAYMMPAIKWTDNPQTQGRSKRGKRLLGMQALEGGSRSRCCNVCPSRGHPAQPAPVQSVPPRSETGETAERCTKGAACASDHAIRRRRLSGKIICLAASRMGAGRDGHMQ